MVKKIKILLISFLMFSCKDAKIIIPKENNNSNKLNLTGYFYLKESKTYKNPNDIYFLYENGIILYVGSPESNDEQTVANYINNEILKFKTIYDKKSGWGLYKIVDNSIEFELWSVRNAGERLKTLVLKGQILDKNTFKIISIYSNYTKKTDIVENTYEFRQFSPKPDSTNNFIK